ncbi:DUF4240 domain-containing protein [Acinetobacter higginsii]|uniref:DUF4240 domain-containing protein n=1 Tax=Acinetobacter higginsii TaxID=70347 RepID=UPI0030BA0FE9
MTTLPSLMPESQFWALMTKVDHPSLLSGQDVASLLPLKSTLSNMHPDEIIAFALRLTERLEKLLIASRARRGPFGDDALLYAACYAIARGQAWFEASLHWPRIFDDRVNPEMNWCESLLYVGCQAWSLATGSKMDDFPVWTLEDGLQPFVNKMPMMEMSIENRALATATWDNFVVYAHFEQHPAIERTVEFDSEVRVTFTDLLDDYFWCLLDLGDYLGLVDETGQSFQILHDASKNLYWAEVPYEAERASYGQEFSREEILALLNQLPRYFSTGMFNCPQKLVWDA